MSYSQCDIGFATDTKKWFLQFFTKTRWFRNNLQVSGELKLENVMIDTYSWADQGNEKLSHGRFRFYNLNTDISGNVKSDNIENVSIQGKNPRLKFQKITGIPKIWYSIQDMEWCILVNGTKYITKDIKGSLTGVMNKEPICFIGSKEIDILYSNVVTLVDVDF